MAPCQKIYDLGSYKFYDSYHFYEYCKIRICHNSVIISPKNMITKMWTRIMNRMFETELDYRIIHNGVLLSF